MTALDNFLQKRNISLCLQCLGEKVSISKINSNGNKNIDTGIFISIDLDNYSKVLIQKEDIMLTKQEIQLDSDFEYIHIENINFQLKKSNRDEIKTDKEIGKSKGETNKKLVEYVIQDDKVGFSSDLLDEHEGFDQFELNKEKFNVKSTYSELNYTTPLNYGSIPEELKRKAERIESELYLNNDKIKNRHVLEERGIVGLNDNEDDEEKYSSVFRNDCN